MDWWRKPFHNVLKRVAQKQMTYEVHLIKVKPRPVDRFQLTFFKDGKPIQDGVWKSKTKILDELKKSGALQGKPICWPKKCGNKIIFKVEQPNWYWSE